MFCISHMSPSGMDTISLISNNLTLRMFLLHLPIRHSWACRCACFLTFIVWICFIHICIPQIWTLFIIWVQVTFKRFTLWAYFINLYVNSIFYLPCPLAVAFIPFALNPISKQYSFVITWVNLPKVLFISFNEALAPKHLEVFKWCRSTTP